MTTHWKRWNHYACPECAGVTVAEHVDEGVTPFLLRCRTKDTVTPRGDRVQGCQGLSESAFFLCSQDDDQQPHVTFYRPPPAQAIQFINRKPVQHRAALLEHYERGGSLLREGR